MSRPTPLTRSSRTMLVVLGLLLVVAVTFAAKAEKPWGKTVAKRLEKHQDLQPKEYAVIGLWWGAVANAGVLVVLLGTARWWALREGPETGGLKPEAGGQKPETEEPNIGAQAESGTRKASTLGWILLLGLLVVAGSLRAPRLSHSLWNDEEYAMRKFAHGAWEQGKDGTWSFEPASWTETLFENRNGNNHLLNSLITREALSVWRAITHAAPEAFSETALRMPAFLAGLLTIVMIYLLGCRVTGPSSSSSQCLGLAAAALLTLCPWHIRYAVEAKGYSFMLLFVCTAMYGLIRALEENRIRWWLLFALSEAAFLLSFAGSIYVAVMLNVFAVVELLRSRAWQKLWALTAFNLLAAIPVVQWMLPSVPQLVHYLHSEGSLHLGLGWPWLRDFFSGLAIGFQYDNPAPAEHSGTSWLMQTGAHAWLVPFFMIAALLSVIGFVCSLFRNLAARLAIAAPTAAVLAAYAHNALAGTPMVVWYLLYVIIPASLAVPLAISKLGGMLVGRKSRGNASIPCGVMAVMILFIVAYGFAVHGPGRRLALQERQPIREAVASTREKDAPALTAVLGVSDRQMQSYDPKVTVLDDRKELASVVSQARQAGRPLFVYVCGRNSIVNAADDKLRSKQPVLDALEHGLKLEEIAGAPLTLGGAPITFAEVARFPGTEAMFSYRVYHLNAALLK